VLIILAMVSFVPPSNYFHGVVNSARKNGKRCNMTVVCLTTLSISETTEPTMPGWLVIEVLERIRKESVMAWSRHYLWICLKELTLNTKNLIQGSRCCGGDTNPAPAQ